MRKTFFLLYVLCAVFATQAGMLFYAGIWCANNSKVENRKEHVCPELGQRYDDTFNLMISTTLALLTGAHLSRRSDEL